MCTSLFFYDFHPTILFLLAFNREEYYERYETSVLANAILIPLSEGGCMQTTVHKNAHLFVQNVCAKLASC